MNTSPLIDPPHVLGERYSIRITYQLNRAGERIAVAVMSKRGCKTERREIGGTAEEARDAVLRYLDERLRPYVRLTIAP